MIKRIVIAVVLFLALVFPVFCSGSAIPVDTVTFNELHDELDFDKTKKIWVLRKPDKPNMPNSGWLDFLGQAVKIIGYLGLISLIVGIVYVVVRMIQKGDSKYERKKINLDEIDDIEAVNLEALLKEALENKDYRLALRIQFLQILQALTASKQVVWKPYKTNRTYALEIEHAETKSGFKHLGDIFEYVWYGVTEINKETYEELSTQYDDFLKNIANEKE